MLEVCYFACVLFKWQGNCSKKKTFRMSRDRASRRFYRMESQNELLAFMDRGEMASCQNRWTFESAWEVANKGERIFY
jgi:hypothetical protein